MKIKLLVAAVALSTTAFAQAEERVASFDLGTLDTLDELGLSDQIVGVPYQNLPDYLSRYQDERYTDIGGLRSPDFDALAESAPSLIFYSGRQGEWSGEFEEIATAVNTGVQGDDYLEAFDATVHDIASRLDAEEQAEQALKALHAHIDAQREALSDAPRVLVVTHNDGSLSYNRHAVVHDVLQLPALDIPDGVPSETFGERTFIRLSADAIAQIAPDVVLVVDRSAAIGNDPLDTDALENELTDAGAEDVRVAVLTPALWYLSGGGLQSLKMQVDEVVEAL
ncbi:ABC transporter substrate-binding protein [Halomonas dongshanensis]|uniref:ABC transporter substrate-binding protein n=1 Tax=Halomonas dongshanensis TaxID=2890835 RepID=A0ABT2EG20_9GAMM|nr:ABC transporter substrate-binding protein [Halomonas dongshanensis]MCS2610500.1 ABC transporter substrate-binding protein [Halomonas dongshanensis]